MSRLIDILVGAALRLFDRISGPMPETEADRVREAEKERLQRAFPGVEIDGKEPLDGTRGKGRKPQGAR